MFTKQIKKDIKPSTKIKNVYQANADTIPSTCR